MAVVDYMYIIHSVKVSIGIYNLHIYESIYRPWYLHIYKSIYKPRFLYIYKNMLVTVYIGLGIYRFIKVGITD